MRKILSAIIVSILLAYSVSSFAQEVRVVEAFTKLYVNGYFDVELVKDNKPGIELTFKDVDADKIITEVKKGELIIKHKFPFANGYKVKVLVKYSSLVEIDVNYNATVKFTDNVIEAQKMRMSASTGGHIIGEVDVTDIKVSCGEGSTVELIGKTKYQDVSVSTGGIIKNFCLTSEVVEASVSTGGKANVKVTEKIDASVSTGGHLNFVGKPKIKDISTILGGSYKELEESQL